MFRMLRAACCMLLLSCMQGIAQVATIGFETFTSEDGLSDNYVLSALQDHRGFLWFGTRDGLNRFDGYSFVVYRHDPGNPGSLADGSVKCLYEDSRKRLWIGTHSSGLDCFDRVREGFYHYRHIPHDTQSISDGAISSICEDRQGDIWVATRGRDCGVSRLDQGTNRFTRFGYDPANPYSISSNNVVAVCRDSSGTIWVATSDSGMNRFDPRTGGFINHRTIPAYAVPAWRPVQAAQTDRSGIIWLLAPGHLVRFDPRTGLAREEPFDTSPANRPRLLATVVTDRSGIRWTASYGHGLLAHNPSWGADMVLRNSPSTPSSIASNTVFCICEDNAGNLWFGTEHGISRVNRRSWQFRWLCHIPYENGTIAGPTVRALATEGNGTLWLGVERGGLDRIDLATMRVEHMPVGGGVAADRTVNTIFIDAHRALWFGATDGLARRAADGSLKAWRANPRNPSSISAGAVWPVLEDRMGRIWAGTLGEGLNMMDPRTGTFHHYRYDPRDSTTLSDDRVLSIFQSRDGTLWVGTDKGLNRLDIATGRFTRFVNDLYDSTSISNNRVWHILEDRHGWLWIATSGGGVNRMNPATGACRRYMENNGFINNTACAIVEDGRGRMWVSSNKGLSCIDPLHETIRNFAPGDGLPVYEFHFRSCARDAAGAIYFGGRGGVIYFHPDSLLNNAHAPPVELVSFRTHDSTFRLDSSIGTAAMVNLEHDNNSFTIEFAALDFTNPAGNRCRYMLEGYDDDWRSAPATRRFAEYTNVPPGRYRFLVAGANSDGIWSAQVRAIEIVIAPAYWQTWWFRALVLLGSAMGIGALLMARIRSVRRAEQRERRVVEFQLQALRAQMNPHFLFNSLNSILYFVMRRDIESARFYLTGFSKLVRNTLENVQSDAVSLAEELESLELYLRMESLRFRDRFDASIEVSPSIDPEEVQIPPMIIQPYVENAIRHGLSHREERGTLSIRISRRMGYLRCSVLDNGVGRRRSEEIQRNDLRAHRAYGMAVTHNRLEALSRLHRQRYRATVTDLVGDDGSALGTRVDILIPLDAGTRTRTPSTTHRMSI